MASQATFTNKDVRELHFMTGIENVPSILQYGIWSHNKSHHVRKVDISNSEVQDRRATKSVRRNVEGRRTLKVHDHAVLYFNGHNAMLYDVVLKQKKDRNSICVLRISPEILKYRHTVVSDQNASTTAVEFFKAQDFSFNANIREAITSDRSVPNDKKIDFNTYKQQRQAEVLVPYRILPDYIQGAYVYSATAKSTLAALLPADRLIIEVFDKLFYNEYAPGKTNSFASLSRIKPLPPLKIEPKSPENSPPNSPRPDADKDEGKTSESPLKRKKT